VNLEFFRKIFEKYSNTKSSSGSGFVPRGQADEWIDGQTDRNMRELIFAVSNFENAPKNDTRYFSLIQSPFFILGWTL
jgi:hypothetical protein